MIQGRKIICCRLHSFVHTAYIYIHFHAWSWNAFTIPSDAPGLDAEALLAFVQHLLLHFAAPAQTKVAAMYLSHVAELTQMLIEIEWIKYNQHESPGGARITASLWRKGRLLALRRKQSRPMWRQNKAIQETISDIPSTCRAYQSFNEIVRPPMVLFKSLPMWLDLPVMHRVLGWRLASLKGVTSMQISKWRAYVHHVSCHIMSINTSFFRSFHLLGALKMPLSLERELWDGSLPPGLLGASELPCKATSPSYNKSASLRHAICRNASGFP